MASQVVNILAALVVGLLSGYFFERRAAKEARKRTAELEEELESMRHSVYSMGGTIASPDIALTHDDLAERVKRRAIANQNSEGKIGKSVLVTYFLEQGYGAAEVNGAIAELHSQGSLRQSGEWLELM